MAGSYAVHMNPAPIKAAQRIALLSSGTRAKALSQARNPAPSRINIVGPTLFRTVEGASIRGTGRLAHLFEHGAQPGFIVPGLRFGRRQIGPKGAKVTKFFSGPSTPSRSLTSSYNPWVLAGGRASEVTRGEQSFQAIRFNRGNKGFYRGAGFFAGGMKERPYMRPGLNAWANGLFQQEFAKSMARIGTAEVGKMTRVLGIAS